MVLQEESHVEVQLKGAVNRRVFRLLKNPSESWIRCQGTTPQLAEKVSFERLFFHRFLV
jgi:hypothetical protein